LLAVLQKIEKRGALYLVKGARDEQGHFSADAIERQLAHLEGNPIRRAYLPSQFLPERRKLMTWWANYVDALRLKDRPARGKVVKFPGFQDKLHKV
jgi:hypothetical protein